MKKIANILYYLRLTLFIIHLFMLFTVLGDIIDVGLMGYLFLIVDSIFILRIIFELLTKKDCYKKEIYYNIMQIGLFSYIAVLWSKLYFGSVILNNEFLVYLKNNCIILIVLIIFLIFYSKFGINNGCKRKK